MNKERVIMWATPLIFEVIVDAGFFTIVNENVEVEVLKDEVEDIKTYLNEHCPAAQGDYGFEEE